MIIIESIVKVCLCCLFTLFLMLPYIIVKNTCQLGNDETILFVVVNFAAAFGFAFGIPYLSGFFDKK